MGPLSFKELLFAAFTFTEAGLTASRRGLKEEVDPFVVDVAAAFATVALLLRDADDGPDDEGDSIMAGNFDRVTASFLPSSCF